ncbi:MAG TPA: site-2 protease family protein [Patescibacteria group bacterium]|nr:site-2 protease family protein [Patescibacteria group bacterium]
MFLTLLSHAPALSIAWLAAILAALTFHEFSHALVATWRGDRTAERAGRLSLNPLSHIDPLGFIPLLLFGFGWAKPVPYNPYNLANPKWDSVAIGLAGPISNLFLAAVGAFFLRLLLLSETLPPDNLLVAFLFLLVLINLFLLFFNLIPVHPLDGSKLFFALFDAPRWAELRAFVANRGPQILFAFVLLSFVGFDVFHFLSAPAFGTCSALLGRSCSGFYGWLFSGI